MRSRLLTASNQQLLQRNHFSTTSTSIFTWGSGSKGQLGSAKLYKQLESEKKTFQAEPRRLLKSKNFVQLSCGEAFTLAVCRNGGLWGWGEGFLDKNSKSLEPTPLPIDSYESSPKFVKVSAGPYHSAAIDKDGLVYTWGSGGSWMSGGGQLGHGDRKSVSKPKLVHAFKEYGARAADVKCGGLHTVILTDDGEVLTCGVGEYGRLGTGSSSDATVPLPLASLEEEDIVRIAGGYSHTLALSVTGKVFSWGKNEVGQLGHADTYMDIYSMEDYPREIETLKGLKVREIDCSRTRSLALTEDGVVYLWGSKLSHYPTPIDKSLFEGMKVVKAVLGGAAVLTNKSAVACITEDGSLWTFGDSSSHMLGRISSGVEAIPARIPLFDMKNNEKSLNETEDLKKKIGVKRVLDVFCGYGTHMAALVEVDSDL